MKQVAARSRSPASQWSPPIFRKRRAAVARSPAASAASRTDSRWASAGVRRPVNAQQIAQPLPDGGDLAVAVRAVGEGPERALVVADGVVVGVHPARPVARGHEVAGARAPCPGRGSSGSRGPRDR